MWCSLVINTTLVSRDIFIPLHQPWIEPQVGRRSWGAPSLYMWAPLIGVVRDAR